MKAFISLLIFLFLFQEGIYSQEQDSIEVYLIENFVTPETPHFFRLSFFTSDECKSKIIIDDEKEYIISDDFTEDHKFELNLSELKIEKDIVPFILIVEDREGNYNSSEHYDFYIPQEIKIEGESNFLLLCLFAGTVFALPSPVYVSMKEESYFSLTKEIPLLFIRSGGYAYPTGYFSIEYSHIFNAPVRNFFRIGYKHIIDIPGIEYVSPGINGFTNFKGFNGISPELSLGLFRVLNTFTLYTRYRFNAKPGEKGSEFHEISIGLYSGFFAIYL